MRTDESKEIIIEPPSALVQTWVSLIRSNESDEVKKHAASKLLAAFGDMKTAAEYCARMGIKYK